MSEDNKVALIRAGKELGRLALLAAAVSIIDAVRAGGKLDWKVVGLGALVAAYRAASTYVADSPDIPWRGLFPF